MTVRKRGSGYATVHCHGKEKGKTISSFDTYGEALDQHRAIKASQARKKKRKKKLVKKLAAAKKKAKGNAK